MASRKSPPQLTSNLLIPLLCHSPMKFRTRLIWSYYSSAAGPPSEICVGIFGHQLIPFLGIILLNFHHLLKLSQYKMITNWVLHGFALRIKFDHVNHMVLLPETY